MIPGLRLFVASVCVAATVWVVTDVATASPPPDAAPRLAWTVQRVEHAVEAWHRDVNPEVPADGLVLGDTVATCQRTKRVPARYRCYVAAIWSYAEEPMETRGVLSSCYPSRRVRSNTVDYDHGRARIVVRRDGRMAGGLVCRYRAELAGGGS